MTTPMSTARLEEIRKCYEEEQAELEAQPRYEPTIEWKEDAVRDLLAEVDRLSKQLDEAGEDSVRWAAKCGAQDTRITAVCKERDGARRMLDRMAEESHTFNTILENTQRDLAKARAQLAALHAAAVAHVRQWHAGDTEIGACDERLDATLADLATAAAEHDARARAPVEAERDQFAAALAEVMTPRGIYDAWSLNRVLRRLADAADHLLNDHSCDRHGYEGVVCARDAARDHAAAIEKLSIPADLAAQREARVRADERAKVLRDGSLLKRLSDAALWESERIVRQVREFDRTGVSTAAYGEWDTLFEIVLGKVLRAMADEAERMR